MTELKRFQLDPKTDKMIKQYVDRNSILEDLRTSVNYIEFTINKYQEWDAIINNPKTDFLASEIIIMNALWQSCVLHYTRCFNHSNSRGFIDKSDVFKILDTTSQETHNQIMKLRNTFTAHHDGDTDHEEFEVFGVIYKHENDIKHRIESVGKRTLVFDLDALRKLQRLFNIVTQWYEATYAQPITDALGKKYSAIHEILFKEGK